MTVRDYIISVIRTLSPLVAGYVLTYAARAGLELDSNTTVMLVFALLSGLYYVTVRALEAKFPVFGILLAWKLQPEYPAVSNGKTN